MDSYTAQMLIYRAEMYILMKYPYLIDLKTKNSELSKSISNNSFFYVIKSFSEEDVHKVKYYRARLLNIMCGHQLNWEIKLLIILIKLQKVKEEKYIYSSGNFLITPVQMEVEDSLELQR